MRYQVPAYPRDHSDKTADMAYYDEFTPDEEAKLGGVWLKGHQDFNSASTLSLPYIMFSLLIYHSPDSAIFSAHGLPSSPG